MTISYPSLWLDFVRERFLFLRFDHVENDGDDGGDDEQSTMVMMTMMETRRPSVSRLFAD